LAYLPTLTIGGPLRASKQPQIPAKNAKKKRNKKKMVFLGCACGHFWDSDSAPGWPGMVDMPILDRYKIGGRKRLVHGFIFGGEYLILVTK